MDFLQTEKFNSNLCDIYSNNTSDIYLTREQIGLALEYEEPAEAIKQIHKRHRDRLDKFCVKIKTPILSQSHEGGQVERNNIRPQNEHLITETTYYSERGIMEICRWSSQPKANEFMDFVFDIYQDLKNGKYALVSRKEFDTLVSQVNEINTKIKYIEEQNNKNTELAQKAYSAISTFESGILVPDGQDSPWATEMGEKLHMLAEYIDISYDELVNNQIAELKPRCGFNFYEYVQDYHKGHKGDRIWKLNVISRYDDLREAFGYLYSELAERYMPY